MLDTLSVVKEERHNDQVQNVLSARVPRNPRVTTRSEPCGNDGNSGHASSASRFAPSMPPRRLRFGDVLRQRTHNILAGEKLE